jgi:hypothetical protein
MKHILSTLSIILAFQAIFAQSKPSTMTHKVKNISVSINKPASEVYKFASNPENFPKWVAFIESVSKQGDIWLGKSSLGDIKIKWSPLNEFGILDHHVTLPNGETVYNPMRIISNDKGSEFVFTLFWMPGRTEKEFNEDAQSVTADLKKLKEIMEK